MNDPLHILKHEHRVIEKALHALDGICLKMSWGEPAAPESLRKLLDFIQTYADRYHHGKEEQYLFPALREYGILRDDGEMGSILREHEVESVLVAELVQAADDYCEGKQEAVAAFTSAARKYSTLLTGHMRKEDNILFRIADGVLDEPARESVTAGFKAAEQGLGDGGRAHYERIALELESDWSV